MNHQEPNSADPRVDLALLRTQIAFDRTTLAWARTTITMATLVSA